MHPRSRRIAALTALCLVALAATPASAQQQDFESVEIKTAPVASGVHALFGRGGNIGVSSGPDGVILIDDQYAPLTDKILAAVRAIDERPVRFVINTHWHGDHTGGNENLAKRGSVIVAHDEVRERLSHEQFFAALDRRTPPAPEAARPVITFSESLTFHLNGDTLRVEHVGPAHTDGDAVIRFEKADVIHTGDVYIRDMYPFVDISTGGSAKGMLAALDRIIAMCGPETRVIPGHGALSGLEDVKRSREMLGDVVGRVERAIAAGQDLDAILASKPTAAWDERFAGGFITPENLVRLVHASLSAD